MIYAIVKTDRNLACEIYVQYVFKSVTIMKNFVINFLPINNNCGSKVDKRQIFENSYLQNGKTINLKSLNCRFKAKPLLPLAE